MKRRDVLARTGTLAVVATAGCLSAPLGSEEPPVGGDTSTGTPGGSPTPTDTPADGSTPDDSPTPIGADASFEVVNVGPGGGDNSATVSFDDGVVVEGTIGGNNGCYRARLADAGQSGGAFRVLVEAYEDRADDEMCSQAVVDVDYEATFFFEGSLPERVVVEHDSMGETVTVADEER